MRAVFCEQLSMFEVGQKISIDGERAAHLVNSVRINSHEQIMILDGKGFVAHAQIVSVSRKKVEVEICAIRSELRKYEIDVAVGITKKESFETIVKNGVELGISKIYPLLSQYSQRTIPSPERIDRIVESGVIQSNNPFATIVETPLELDEISDIAGNYDEVIVFSTVENDSKQNRPPLKLNGKFLTILGPEGGFSLSEENQFMKLATRRICLPTPILRTPTAQCVAIGVLLAKGFLT